MAIDAVVEIRVPDEEIVKRMSGRRVHPASGRIYHVDFNPPRQAGKDDETGEPLIQRDDDKEETVRERLAVYHRQTHPLVEFYRRKAQDSQSTFAEVDGLGEVDEVQKNIVRALRHK